MDRESSGPFPFHSSVLPSPTPISPRVSPIAAGPLTPNRGWVLLGVGTPPLPQPPLRGAGPRGLAFTFAPPSLPPTPLGPAWLEGASVGRGSGPGSQQAPGGPSGQGKPGHAPFCSFVLLVVPQFPPSGVRSLPLPQLPFSGASPIPPPLPLPFAPPCPTSYPVAGGSSHPLRCPWSPTSAW